MFAFVRAIVSRFNAAAVAQHFKPLFKFFLLSFDIRRLHAHQLKTLETVEDAVVSAFLALSLKLNDEQFRGAVSCSPPPTSDHSRCVCPGMFLKLVEWMGPVSTLTAESKGAGERPDVNRCITFFHVLDTLAAQLKVRALLLL